MRRVVVTGIGALTGIGKTAAAFKHGLFNGVSGADFIKGFDATEFKTRFAIELKDFDIKEYLPHRQARRLDPFTWYALIVAEEAMKDSGIDIEKINPDRAGVIWGSGIGGFETIEKDVGEETLNQGPPRYNPFFIPKLIVDIAPGHISIKYGFRGPNFATVSACASSNNAIGASLDTIRLGRADVMITGGSEATVIKAGVGGFGSMKALSTRNDDPKTASRPFDADRDGFVLGEGGGALILESLEHAQARGAKIYAEVAGTASTADAHHITAPHPEGLGASNVMKSALIDAHMDKSEIDYINVHGTSTPLGDIAESKAILSVFKDHSYKLNISSTKSMTGHLLGAAGAVEAIAGIMALQHNVIPPTINHFTDDDRIDRKLNFTFNEAQEREVNAVLSNTFGFGGHNSTMIFKKFVG